jgi:hypothetical protein
MLWNPPSPRVAGGFVCAQAAAHLGGGDIRIQSANNVVAFCCCVGVGGGGGELCWV